MTSARKTSSDRRKNLSTKGPSPLTCAEGCHTVTPASSSDAEAVVAAVAALAAEPEAISFGGAGGAPLKDLCSSAGEERPRAGVLLREPRPAEPGAGEEADAERMVSAVVGAVTKARGAASTTREACRVGTGEADAWEA